MNTRVKGSSIDLVSLTNMVSLLDLGPRGSDITIALQLALNNDYGIIIPKGSWVTGTITVPDNGIIIGHGPLSILRLRDAANVVHMNVGSNCMLKDFVLDGNKTNQVGSGLHAVNIIASTRTKIFNVLAYNPKGCGFFIGGGTSELDLINVGVTGYVDTGIKVASSNNCGIYNPTVYNSDSAATGDAIGIISDGSTINGLTIDAPKIVAVANRGIALIGNGAKNVSNVSVATPRIMNAASHGIHMFNANEVSVTNGHVKANSGDGIRLEGDVQNSRIMAVQLNSNVGYGLREVANGSTPNNNGFIGNSLVSNGSNLATKLGANSFVLG